MTELETYKHVEKVLLMHKDYSAQAINAVAGFPPGKKYAIGQVNKTIDALVLVRAKIADLEETGGKSLEEIAEQIEAAQ